MDARILELLERIAGALEAQTEALKALANAPRKTTATSKKSGGKYDASADEDKEWEFLKGKVQDVFATDRVIKYDVDTGSTVAKVVVFANYFTKHPELANYAEGDRLWVKGEWKDNVFKGKSERQFIVRGIVSDSAPAEKPANTDTEDDDVPF